MVNYGISAHIIAINSKNDFIRYKEIPRSIYLSKNLNIIILENNTFININ